MASVNKANQIPHINVISPNFEVDDGDGVWWVRSQHHPSVIYKIHAPFTKYASFTCEWALQGNFYKHQIVVLLMCTNLTTNNIIDYCGMYYGTHRGGLKCMFTNSRYLQFKNGASNDEDYNQDLVDEVGIVDIGGLIATDGDSCLDNLNVLEGSSTPMDRTLIRLCEIMVDITIDSIASASVELCNHARSL
jgi:hypothetical protein